MMRCDSLCIMSASTIRLKPKVQAAMLAKMKHDGIPSCNAAYNMAVMEWAREYISEEGDDDSNGDGEGDQ